MLYDPHRHTQLIDQDWNPGIVQEYIDGIFNNTLNSFDSENFWPAHKDEDSKNSSNKSI